MTDNVNTPAPDMDDDELFQGAQDQFPSKFDLRDRLVVIYPTGKSVTRQGENGSYTAYETTTVVLDDGPKGWQPMVLKGDDMEENLVPSVVENGPQVLTKMQWSPVGIASRVAGQLPGRMVQGQKVDRPGSVLGRINARKNSKPGLAAPWSIAKPTDEDMQTARKYRDICKAARDAIVAEREQAADDDAF